MPEPGILTLGKARAHKNPKNSRIIKEFHAGVGTPHNNIDIDVVIL